MTKIRTGQFMLSQRGAVLPLIIFAVVALLLVGGGAFFFLMNGKSSTPKTSQSKQLPTPLKQPKSSQTPSQAATTSSLLQTEYDNPFAQTQTAINPFSDEEPYQNPFESI